MISNNYGGNLGNHLFQYCSARILAELFSYEIDVPYIKGFPRTAEKTKGSVFDNVYSPRYRMLPFSELVEDLRKNAIDQNKSILLKRYYGYHYREYIEPNINKIRSWLKLDSSIKPLVVPNSNDVLINVRNSDFITRKVALPFGYYEQILQNMSDIGRIYITSDENDHPFMDMFSKFNPIYINGDYLRQFKTITLFKRCIASHSTFTWWALLLNECMNECYYPVLASTKNSAWSERLIYVKHFDLRIDLPQFTYVYNVPKQHQNMNVSIGDKSSFDNSPIRNQYLKENSDKLLNYHRMSKYIFLETKKC